MDANTLIRPASSKSNFERRLFISGLCVLLFALNVSGQEQQPGKIYRIGYITNAPGMREHTEKIFQKALRELGYIDGNNTAIEWRFSKGKGDRLPGLAGDLVRAKVDCIVALGIASTRASKQATSVIPIVMGNADDDPVRQGLVESLARPGGNVTGIISIASDLAGKRLELLKQTIPSLSRLAILWDSRSPGGSSHIRESEAVATALKLSLHRLEIRTPEDLDSAFQTLRKAPVEALVVVTAGVINTYRGRILDFAAKTRLPAIYTNPSYVPAGGLMSYADDRAARMARVAELVDKILKGAKPAEMPIERARKFNLVINLKTAKKIGLTIPPTVLYRADKVIQ